MQSRCQTPLGTLLTTVPSNCHLRQGHGRTSTLQHNATVDLRSINCDVTSISGMKKLCFLNLVDTLDYLLAFMFNVSLLTSSLKWILIILVQVIAILPAIFIIAIIVIAITFIMLLLLLLSTPLHQRAASRVQHPNHVAANSLSPRVARKGSTLSGFVQRSRLEREVGRDLHSNKWEEV